MKHVHLTSFPIMVSELCVRFIGPHEENVKGVVRIFDQDSKFFFCIDYEVAIQLEEGKSYVLVYVPEPELNYAMEVLFLGKKEQEPGKFEIKSYIDKGFFWIEILLLAYGHMGYKMV